MIFIKRSQPFPPSTPSATTSNSRRSSWTTRWPRDRPSRSTLHPQVEGALGSSSCLHAHHSRNHRVLRRPLPLLPPHPNNGSKSKGKGKGKNNSSNGSSNNSGDNSTGALVLPSFYNPWTGTISMWPGMRPPQQQPCPPQHTDVLQGSRWSILHTPAGSSTTPTGSRGSCLVTLDGRVGSAVIGQLLQRHGLDSPDGHQLGRGLRRLQPHHIGCR
jgi:hypothetical protein